MHVKRIYRPSVREALLAAREELGPGALVLSTELVPALGWRGWVGQRVVRLTAAAERPSIDAVERPAEMSTDRPDVTPRRHRRVVHARAGAIARLVSIGMDRAFAEAVVNRLTDSECTGGSEDALRRAVTAELEQLAVSDNGYERYEVFVGPPGMGKTTTIAKIAAQECVAGGQTLNLVATDTLRAGAIEQLRAYAAIMRLPFRIARTADELDQALIAARNPVLVDTAGRSASDQRVTDLFGVLDRKRKVRTHLVLAADTSGPVARRIIDRYAPLKPSRVVITKIDEAESVMPLLAAVREHGLPVSYLAAGQRVPEDLRRATPASLAAVLLREPALEEVTCH
jgi:flagellar biosynthesis protein FlhF